MNYALVKLSLLSSLCLTISSCVTLLTENETSAGQDVVKEIRSYQAERQTEQINAINDLVDNTEKLLLKQVEDRWEISKLKIIDSIHQKCAEAKTTIQQNAENTLDDSGARKLLDDKRAEIKQARSTGTREEELRAAVEYGAILLERAEIVAGFNETIELRLRKECDDQISPIREMKLSDVEGLSQIQTDIEQAIKALRDKMPRIPQGTVPEDQAMDDALDALNTVFTKPTIFKDVLEGAGINVDSLKENLENGTLGLSEYISGVTRSASGTLLEKIQTKERELTQQTTEAIANFANRFDVFQTKEDSP